MCVIQSFRWFFLELWAFFFISFPKGGSTSLTPWLLYFCIIQCILCPVLYHFCWSFRLETFCKYLSITLHSTQPISQRTNQAYFSWLMLTGSNVMKRKSYTTWFEVHFLSKFSAFWETSFQVACNQPFRIYISKSLTHKIWVCMQHRFWECID